MLANFLKKLQIFNVLYGSKAKKLTGVRDRNNKFTDTITFVASDEIQLTAPPPEYLKSGSYFRVKNGGGANQDVLFRVASIVNNSIFVDGTNTVTSFGPAIADIDARLAVVHNNPAISKLNSSGDTIYNVSNTSATTGLDDCSDLGLVLAEHYHDSSSIAGQVYYEAFTLGDWFVSDSGDTYSVDITHNLDVSFPDTTVFEVGLETEPVWLHKIKVLDSNSIRLTVSRRGADGRFSGTVRVEK